VSPAGFHPTRALDAISQAIHENMVGSHERYKRTYVVFVDGCNELSKGFGHTHATYTRKSYPAARILSIVPLRMAVTSSVESV
jgi:hypothetical protein